MYLCCNNDRMEQNPNTVLVNGVFFVCVSGQLPVEYMRGQPLCMELYPLLFSSCRIPGPKHDYVIHHRRSPTHITVVRNYQVTGEGASVIYFCVCVLWVAHDPWKIDINFISQMPSVHLNIYIAATL